MEESFVTLQRLHAALPEDEEIREYLAGSARFSANQLLRTDAAVEGQGRMEFALELQRAILEETGGDPLQRQRLAQILRDLSVIQRRNEDLEGARLSIEEALATVAELRRLDPEDLDLDRTEGTAQLAYAGVLVKFMDLEAAQAAVKRSVTLLGSVTMQRSKTDADITCWLLARALECRLSDELEDHAGARRAFEPAIFQAENVLRQQPGSRNFQYALSRLLHWDARGSVRGTAPADADLDEPRARIDRAVEMMAKLHTDYPDSEGFHYNYVDALTDQALVRWRHSGDLDDALAISNRAIASSRDLLESNDSPGHREQLGLGLLTKAEVLLEAKREEEALGALDESVALLRAVSEDVPANRHFQSGLERALRLRATVSDD
jgi:tetratricopeptide (TPR) repeat protein